MIETRANITIRGSAHYTDAYVKTGGRWRMRSTGYRRISEEVSSRADTPSLQLTANCWAQG